MTIKHLLNGIFVFLLVSPAVMAQTTTGDNQSASKSAAGNNSSPASAASAAKPASAWSGEAEIGILVTRGNTHTSSQNIKLGVAYTTGKWEHKLRLASLHSTDSGVVSADRFSALYRSTRQIGMKAYAFGDLRHVNDRFAGFIFRNTEVIGYGRKLYRTSTFKWDAEVGGGARQSHYTDDTRRNDGIVRLATELEWKFTPTSDFKQHLFVETGSANTLTQSTSSLSVKINSSLAMKLGLNIQNNSKIPPGKKHTDTTTSVTLVYDFTG